MLLVIMMIFVIFVIFVMHVNTIDQKVFVIHVKHLVFV